MARTEEDLRAAIAALIDEYFETKFTPRAFVPGESPVRYAGRVFDATELKRLVDASLDFWLTSGRFTADFERTFADFVSAEDALLVNSGSSANFIAVSALTSPLLGDRRLVPGDEVITVAAGFPTTVNPIIQHGLVPVFVDIALGTYNAPAQLVASAVGPRTRAVFLAHTLGNPFDVRSVAEIARMHGLWLIEDCCDALGSTFEGRVVGSWGDVATCSFYPAHHITTGEGGCVFTSNDLIARAARSIRDWGRDCYCAGGETDTCGKRFSGQYGTLPAGYDHKYVYSHIGYNLKATDLQAAIGTAQLEKLPDFIRARKENFDRLRQGFRSLDGPFILPEATPRSDPAWFAFPVTVEEGAGFSRTQLTRYLNQRRIETRNLFAGNLLRQPAYESIVHRVATSLAVTDRVMNDTFFLGTYPGLGVAQIAYVLHVIKEFLDGRSE